MEGDLGQRLSKPLLSWWKEWAQQLSKPLFGECGGAAQLSQADRVERRVLAQLPITYSEPDSEPGPC